MRPIPAVLGALLLAGGAVESRTEPAPGGFSALPAPQQLQLAQDFSLVARDVGLLSASEQAGPGEVVSFLAHEAETPGSRERAQASRAVLAALWGPPGVAEALVSELQASPAPEA